jgi:hypothetical protein
MPAHEGDYALPAFQRRLLLGVTGTLQREGEGEHAVVRLIAKRLFDPGDLLRRLLTPSREFQRALAKSSSRLDARSRHPGTGSSWSVLLSSWISAPRSGFRITPE